MFLAKFADISAFLLRSVSVVLSLIKPSVQLKIISSPPRLPCQQFHPSTPNNNIILFCQTKMNYKDKLC